MLLADALTPSSRLQDVDEALKRLPQDVVDARNQRLKRACDINMKVRCAVLCAALCCAALRCVLRCAVLCSAVRSCWAVGAPARQQWS